MFDVKTLRVVIADDHPMLLQGLQDTLVRGGIQGVVAVSDGASALQKILDLQPDLAIVDIEMPYLSGFSIAAECQKKGLNTRFIVLSYHKEAEFIAQAQSLNISGYLLKEDTSAELFNCMQAVMEGQFYFSRAILEKDLKFANKTLERLASLSPSEKKILKMIASQLSSQQIADKLHLSGRTIEKHRSNIITKLGLSGQANSLTLWSLEQKAVIMNL